MTLDCWYLHHGIYMDNTKTGYRVLPCCQYTHVEDFETVESPAEIHEQEFMKQIKDEFSKGIKHEGCRLCWENERVLGYSKRTRTDDYLEKEKYNGIHQNWDLRPGNVCNLKCVMCQPTLSSKWYEDIDIWEKHREQHDQIKKIKEWKPFDWEYVYKHTPNNAYKIYIAGGEPLYDKKVYQFIEYLSTFEWNIEYTNFLINTNGISYTEKWNNVFKKFKRTPSFIISVDGTEEVDNYIRFPSDYNTKKKQTRYIKKQGFNTDFNLTISALNFPNTLKILKTWKAGCNTLEHPYFLHYNSLKPDVINRVKKTKNKPAYIDNLIKQYQYNEDGNRRLKSYLKDLDAKRGTNSMISLPWCWV